MKFLVKVVLLAIAFYFVPRYVDGIHVTDVNANAVLGLSITYVWLGLLFAVINAVLRPVFKLLSLPFLILTLGITAAASTKLQIDGLWPALVGGFILALVSWVADLLLNRD